MSRYLAKSAGEINPATHKLLAYQVDGTICLGVRSTTGHERILCVDCGPEDLIYYRRMFYAGYLTSADCV